MTVSNIAPPHIRSRLEIPGGIVLLCVGVVLAIPGVPGPGIPLILAGLFILRKHLAWAQRSLDWLREKAHVIGSLHKSPRQTETATTGTTGADGAGPASA